MQNAYGNKLPSFSMGIIMTLLENDVMSPIQNYFYKCI